MIPLILSNDLAPSNCFDSMVSSAGCVCRKSTRWVVKISKVARNAQDKPHKAVVIQSLAIERA